MEHAKKTSPIREYEQFRDSDEVDNRIALNWIHVVKFQDLSAFGALRKHTQRHTSIQPNCFSVLIHSQKPQNTTSAHMITETRCSVCVVSCLASELLFLFARETLIRRATWMVCWTVLSHIKCVCVSYVAQHKHTPQFRIPVCVRARV